MARKVQKPAREWPAGHEEFMREFAAYTPEQKARCIVAAQEMIADLLAKKAKEAQSA